MGREVRMVPPGWEHPKDDQGVFWPLMRGTFEAAYAEWKNVDAPEWRQGREMWALGLVTDYAGGWVPVDTKYAGLTWEEYTGGAPEAPLPTDHMPDFGDKATHYMMYETVSEGTPISPAFETPEALARWLVDNGASAFGGSTASYEGWLRVARGGYAPSFVIDNKGARSGVDL